MSMKWVKKGLIYNVDGRIDWATNSVLTPQPFMLTDEVIRVYGSMRDELGRGRIGYVDVLAKNPGYILNVSEKPVLDLGKPGMFDDNGLLLGDVLRVNNKVYMYYVGFQIPAKAKFIACSGLAISEDGGNSFIRIQETPVADRTPNAPFGRCIHTVLYENGIFRVWYAVIHGWHYIDNKPYPAYNIRYMESVDGIHFFDETGQHCLGCNKNEYRIGRPRVKRLKDGSYVMRYTSDTLDKQYVAGLAYSKDGIHWERHDEESGLLKSKTGWDSEMACYPVEIETKYGTYMFYDGNGMGATGFGYCKLEE